MQLTYNDDDFTNVKLYNVDQEQSERNVMIIYAGT